MSNWNHSVMYYDHQLTDKLDELAKMVADRITELESCKHADLYDDCIYTSMADI